MNNSFTVSFWARGEASGGPDPEEEYFNVDSYHLGISYQAHAPTPQIRFNAVDSWTNPVYVPMSQIFSYQNSWKHFSIVWGSNKVAFFVNGLKQGERAMNTAILPNERVAFGRHWWNNGASSAARMDFQLDEVRFYNRALSPQEVGQLYGAESGKVAMELVTVGDPGNPADVFRNPDGTTDSGRRGYGTVDRIYKIGKYEVTVQQYCNFLNAVAASDPYNLYGGAGITQAGAGGSFRYVVVPGFANKPITGIGWLSAARFCNWLHNGGTNGASTETGAYTLNGAADGVFPRNAAARYSLPTENEWYKAAYYDPEHPTYWPNGGYWRYAVMSSYGYPPN